MGIIPEPSGPRSRPVEPEYDPYEEPVRRTRDEDDDFVADVRRKRGSALGGRVMAPAICMMIVAILCFFLCLFNIVMAVATKPPPPDPNLPPFLQDVMKNTHGPVAALVQGAFTLVSLITIIGSVQMLRLKSWGLGITASVLSMINFASCCCILGLPFGIWALVVLSSSDVKEAFS
jgi:hypothetical protein